MKQQRKIISIDEEKCNGCGLCVSACAEGAIRIMEGKARLISETYCDGLGACIGECPQGALIITEKEADAFDEQAVANHARQIHAALERGCPGAAARQIEPPAAEKSPNGPTTPSRLTSWPIQLMLIPTDAPYLSHADLVISADCVPCAYGDFHRRIRRGPRFDHRLPEARRCGLLRAKTFGTVHKKRYTVGRRTIHGGPLLQRTGQNRSGCAG